MPLVQIPEDVWEEIRAKAQARAEATAHEMVAEYASRFVDVTSMDDVGKRLMHVLTGRILSIRAEWEE